MAITPYLEGKLSDSKAEFNRRHSTAATCAQKALTGFKDTWKCLQGETSCAVSVDNLVAAVHACCYLHNIVMDMEEDADMSSIEEPDDPEDDESTSSVEEPDESEDDEATWSAEESDDSEELRQLAIEDAVGARDMLSRYFLTTMSSESGVGLVDAEEDHEVVASGSGGEDKEQEAQKRTSEDEIIS